MPKQESAARIAVYFALIGIAITAGRYYDALAAAAARSQPYHSPLGPPRRVT